MTAYEFMHIDPDNLPVSEGPPFRGTKAECPAGAMLDVIHVALDVGMTHDDVDQALARVVEHVAHLNRERFTVHRKRAT